jgi:hypothetical protein
MARFSGYWTTGGAVGQQVAGYTQSHERQAATVIASTHGNNGVAPNYANALAGTHPAANTVRIDTGGAVVDGKWFINDAAYDVNVPNAGAGTTRYDRVLLRASWAGFIVEVQVKTGDAVNPPALTETSETTYEIPLYIAEVTDAGVITLTDERQFGQVDTDGIADDAVAAGKIADGAVDVTATLANDIVDDTKVGNRVPQFYRRQGGDAVDWSVEGNTDRTPTTVRMQAGVREVSIAAAFSGSVAITFPVAFSDVPIIYCTARWRTGILAGGQTWSTNVTVPTANGFTPVVWLGSSHTCTLDVYWLAIGPE